jgi:hypothetical protein
MSELLRSWLAKSPYLGVGEIVTEDGSRIDYMRGVSLLKQDFDCILLNLRLPAMLSIRLAEIVHLAKVPTRLILVSGAPTDLSKDLLLFDNYIRIPFHAKGWETVLDETLGSRVFPQNRLLPSQEHLDLAILNLLQNYNLLAPTSRSALHAFGLYRDAYLHRLTTTAQQQSVLSSADPFHLIDFFAEIHPLNFSKRISVVMDAVNQSRFYLPWQKLFLSTQLSYLLDAIGLTLFKFRLETEEVLKGLEQFARLARYGRSDTNSSGLSELLLNQSRAMNYVHQGIIQIVSLLP